MPHLPDRQSHRWDHHDYTAGGYFVTICTHERRHLFGAVVDEAMRLNERGEIADTCWRAIPDHFEHVELDEHVIMPNHVHGVLWLVGATHCVARTSDNDGDTDNLSGRGIASPLQRARGLEPGSLGAIVGAYKSAVTRRINRRRDTAGAPVWQRNYYDHVIRTNDTARAIRAYIADNPVRWHLDRYNTDATRIDPLARTLWNVLRGTTNSAHGTKR